MRPSEIIQKKLDFNADRVIQKLEHIYNFQVVPYLEIIENNVEVTKLIKNQKELERKSQEQLFNTESKDVQQSMKIEYTQSVEQENFQQKEKIQKLESQVEQLLRDIKNLREETALKTEVFQQELTQRFTDSKSMPFTRITIPRSVEQYKYIQEQDILIQCEKEEPIPLLKLYSIDKKSLSNNIYSNSIGQSFSCFSVYGDRLIWSTENSTEVEIWTFNQPPEPLKRIGIIPAHTDTVNHLQFVSQNVFLTSTKRGVLKMWRVDTQQLLKSFRFNSYITHSQLLPYRVLTNSNQPNDSSDFYQIIAGFSDGSVKILELSNIINDPNNIKCDIIYEVNVSTKSNQFCEVDCISVAIQLESKQSLNSVKECSINQIIIAASITPEPDNIYIIIPEKKKIHSVLEFKEMNKKIYRNSNNKKQFTLTKEHLIAGSFDGQIFVWDIKLLTHPLRANTPQLNLKLSSHTLSAVPVLMAAYDQSRDILITGDEQGNVLKWENFIQNTYKQ